jgi:hypothetical protein
MRPPHERPAAGDDLSKGGGESKAQSLTLAADESRRKPDQIWSWIKRPRSQVAPPELNRPYP